MLAAAQIQLEQHFAGLAAARKALGFPVYALEHGLEPDMTIALARAASDDLRIYGVRDPYWLVWVVLAAEAGYRYAGEEYWPELEVVAREWRNNHNRTWLRRRFKRFSDRFSGPIPVGRWADQFTNIAWPIANAILPRYLQAHFAELLFARRYALADLASADTGGIGDLLSDQYHGSSVRFADFLQQVDLTTQIVLALRDEDLGAGAPRIMPALLGRIVDDLEQRRESREYLRAARRVISTRRASVSAALRGPSVGSLSAAVDSAHVAGLRLAARRLGDESVVIGLVFPDIAAALAKAGLSDTALASAQIRLAGAESRPEPALALLTYSRSDRELQMLPAAGGSVASIEGADDGVRALLEPLLQIAAHGCWVLRRHADGLYREVLGGHVRPGQAYVIVTRTPWSEPKTTAAGLVRLIARATGMAAYALDLGLVLEEPQRLALAALTISSVTGSRVEPVGLAPSSSTASSTPTWLASETVTLRVSADFDVAGFRAQLDDAPEEILSADNGELLIALGPLALGAHHLRVQALAHAKGTTAPVGATAQFDFTVAPPQPWPEAMREKAGFRVLLDPPNAGLEQLFSGRATLRLLGPAGRSVLWSLETFDAAGHPTAIGVGGQTTIGAPAGAIATTLDRLRQTNSEAIDNAHRVDIVASLGELGRQSVAFPHQVDPLRWHFDSSSRQVRLIDESAHESPVAVRSYALSAPVAQKTIDYDEAVTGIEVGAPGALMVADYEHRRFSLFASAPASDRLNSLADLGIAQTLTIAKSDLDATLILLSSLWRWHGARSVGPQAVIRKVMTLDRIESELAARLCGQDLMHALSQREATPFTRAQSLVGGSPGFGFRMRTFPSLGSEEGKALFAEIACRYAIESDSVRCGIAYALAFSPATLRLGKAEAARSQMADLLANRVLLRGAFLARTASHAAGQAALSETA